MVIKKVDSGLLHSCMYIVEENGHGIVIDPCKDTSAAAGLTVDHLIVTHEHYDHISGVNEWKQASGAPLLCSEACAANVKNPKKNMSRYFDIFYQMQTWMPVEEKKIEAVEYSCEADSTFADRMTFAWQGHVITLMEVPGHSVGSIGIDIDHTDFFSGDSLLEEYEVELRFPGGSAEKWEEIGKKRIEALPEGTRIWPGHFDSFIWHKPL
jgi:glyoxylase-like metal-dependent hydrolase (beta-lactamase superfamily II)